MNPTCPYCNGPSTMVEGDYVYPHRPDLYHKLFYICDPCDARVGCHPKTNVPLGRLANASLRRAKSKAHEAFDPLWKLKLFKSRSKAYNWLSTTLAIPPKDCHIGMFDEETCQRVVDACYKFRFNV